jgi:hypothetical protein
MEENLVLHGKRIEDASQSMGVSMSVFVRTDGQESAPGGDLSGIPTHLSDVGFSVALPTQMRYVHEVVAELRDAGEQLPRILVGGPIARTGSS